MHTQAKPFYLHTNQYMQLLNILSPENGHAYFWPSLTQIVWKIFNLCEFSSSHRKIRLFHCYNRRCDWILQSDWLKTFLPISKEQTFSQMWDLCRNTANNINFHYRTNTVKINDQFFTKSKKPYFWSIFSFWG